MSRRKKKGERRVRMTKNRVARMEHERNEAEQMSRMVERLDAEPDCITDKELRSLYLNAHTYLSKICCESLGIESDLVLTPSERKLTLYVTIGYEEMLFSFFGWMTKRACREQFRNMKKWIEQNTTTDEHSKETDERPVQDNQE